MKLWKLLRLTGNVSMLDFAIKIDHLYKSYYKRRNDYFLSFFKKLNPENKIEVLKNINLSIPKGQIVGLIGKNGAGKSTLLRAIAGILGPDNGRVHTIGNITNLIDLEFASDPFKSGRQNIFLTMQHRGFSKKEIESFEQDIIDFSELNHVIDNTISSYSTGMKMRLAFSVACIPPTDILLIDEVLSVGDEFFAAKSFLKLQELIKSGCTCVIVSHDWSKIFRLVDRVVWIEDHEVRMDGNKRDVLYSYLEYINSYIVDSKVVIKNIKTKNNKGDISNTFKNGDDIVIEVDYEKKDINTCFSVIVGIISDKTGEGCISHFSLDNDIKIKNNKFRYYFSLSLKNVVLYKGLYQLNILLTDPELGPFTTTIHDIWSPVVGKDLLIKITDKPSIKENNKYIIDLEPNWHVGNK